MRSTILLVMDSQHRAALAHDLKASNVVVAEAADLRTARKVLGARRAVNVVISDPSLPDGTWCSLLQDMEYAGISAPVLVCADRQGQLLCGRVVRRGGYYALEAPHQWRDPREAVVDINPRLPRGERPARVRAASAA